MKIPNSVRIGGIEYEIEYVENLRNQDELCYGVIDYNNCKIQLSATDGKSHQKRCVILWHEILHGIREHAGLEIENEEEVVEMFAKGIYQVLQDNGRRLFDLKETRLIEVTADVKRKDTVGSTDERTEQRISPEKDRI